MTVNLGKASLMLCLLVAPVVFQTSGHCVENYLFEIRSLDQQGRYEEEIALQHKWIGELSSDDKQRWQRLIIKLYLSTCMEYFERLHQPAKALPECELANDKAKLDPTAAEPGSKLPADLTVMLGIVREAVDGSDQSGMIRQAFYSWPMGSLQVYLNYLQSRNPEPQAEIQTVQQVKDIYDGLFSTLEADKELHCGEGGNSSTDAQLRFALCWDGLSVIRYNDLITSVHKAGIHSFDAGIANEIRFWEEDTRDSTEKIMNSDNSRDRDSGNSIFKFAGMLVAGLITVKTGNTNLANSVAVAAGNSQSDASAMESQLLEIKNIVKEYGIQQQN